MASQHPRQFGYFTPPPLAMSMMGELLAQMANQGVDVWHAGPLASFVEEEVVRWLCDLVGYDDGSFGLLTSRRRDGQLHGDGDRARPAPRPDPRDRAAAARRRARGCRVYASDQTHFSVARALDLLGFPGDTLVRRARPTTRSACAAAAVAEAVARDLAAGLTPFAISAVAGSTNTGSVDAVGELADVAAAEGLWLHVDAAYGGGARLSDARCGRVPDLDRADSVTVDPHKWFFQAYDIGGLLVRDGRTCWPTFGGRAPEYYRGGEGARPGAPRRRPTTARRRARRPRRPRRPAELLQAQLRGHPPLARAQALDVVEAPRHERVRPAHRGQRRPRGAARPPLRGGRRLRGHPRGPGAVGRVLPAPAGRRWPAMAAALDAHQDRLQAPLEVSGDGWLTTTRLRGATWLRAGIVNYLWTEDDIDRLLWRAAQPGLADDGRTLAIASARVIPRRVVGHPAWPHRSHPPSPVRPDESSPFPPTTSMVQPGDRPARGACGPDRPEGGRSIGRGS